jgi:hypothetical protein
VLIIFEKKIGVIISSADPSFWVIHPTLERLFQEKLLSGGFQNEKWAHNEYEEYCL